MYKYYYDENGFVRFKHLDTIKIVKFSSSATLLSVESAVSLDLVKDGKKLYYKDGEFVYE